MGFARVALTVIMLNPSVCVIAPQIFNKSTANLINVIRPQIKMNDDDYSLLEFVDVIIRLITT